MFLVEGPPEKMVKAAAVGGLRLGAAPVAPFVSLEEGEGNSMGFLWRG